MALFAAAACGGQPNEGEQPESAQPEATVQQQVGAEGGVVELPAAASLSIPAGALSTDTDISIEQRAVPAEAQDYLLSLYEFGPDRLVFTQPATLTLNVGDAGLDDSEGIGLVKLVTSTSTDGETTRFVQLQDASSYSSEAGTVSALVDGFSAYGAARYVSCCVPVRPAEIVSVSWDGCGRRTTLEWSSGSAPVTAAWVYIERWSRQGGGGALPSSCIGSGAASPHLCSGYQLDWGTVIRHNQGGTHITAANPMPGPNELAYTYVYRVYGARRGQRGPIELSAGFGEATLPAPEFVKPDAPENVSVNVVSADRIQVVWNPSSNLDDFYSVARVSRLPRWTSIDNPQVVLSGSTVFTDTTDLRPNVNYTYTVRHVNTQSCSYELVSDAVSASVVAPTSPPGALPSLTATEANGAVLLEWTEAPTATRYRVERAEAGGAFAALATVFIPELRYEDASAQPSTSYTYRVTPANDSGDGPTSEVTITTGAPSTGRPVTNECPSAGVRLTVAPAMQTVSLSSGAAASFAITMDWLAGNTNTMTLSLQSPDFLSYEASALLGNATTLDGNPPNLGTEYYLFDQPPTQSGTLTLTPSTVFFGLQADVAQPRTLPYTYTLVFSATGCPVSVQLEVTP